MYLQICCRECGGANGYEFDTESQCGLTTLPINAKKGTVESNKKSTPRKRKIVVIILVFRARCSVVGGGLMLGWRSRRLVVHALYWSERGLAHQRKRSPAAANVRPAINIHSCRDSGSCNSGNHATFNKPFTGQRGTAAQPSGGAKFKRQETVGLRPGQAGARQAAPVTSIADIKVE